MKTAKAKLSHLRMSPRKVRLVVDLVRGKSVESALAQLTFSPKMAARPVKKLIESASANAINNFKMDESSLYIAEIAVNEGSTIKRWRPRAHGRAAPIRKRTSHVTVVLAERGGNAPAKIEKKVDSEKDTSKKSEDKKPVEKKTVKKAVKKVPAKKAEDKTEKKTATKVKKESKKPESEKVAEKKTN